ALVRPRRVRLLGVDLRFRARDAGRAFDRGLHGLDLAHGDPADARRHPDRVVPGLVLLGIPVLGVVERRAVDLLHAAGAGNEDLHVAGRPQPAAGGLAVLAAQDRRDARLRGLVAVLGVQRPALGDRALALGLVAVDQHQLVAGAEAAQADELGALGERAGGEFVLQAADVVLGQGVERLVDGVEAL